MKTIKIKNVEVRDDFYMNKEDLIKKYRKFLSEKDINKLYLLIKKNEPTKTKRNIKKTIGRKRSK